jgi:hypothetical protein
MRVFLTWFITAGCATLASIALMNMPILSRLIGRKAGEHKSRPIGIKLSLEDRQEAR